MVPLTMQVWNLYHPNQQVQQITQMTLPEITQTVLLRICQNYRFILFHKNKLYRSSLRNFKMNYLKWDKSQPAL